jgi:hypothetical protein
MIAVTVDTSAPQINPSAAVVVTITVLTVNRDA